MDGFGENIPIIGFFHGNVDISGAVEAFIRDLHGLSGNLLYGSSFPQSPFGGKTFLIHFPNTSTWHRHQIHVQERACPIIELCQFSLEGPFCFAYLHRTDQSQSNNLYNQRIHC